MHSSGLSYTHIQDALINGSYSPSNTGFDVLFLSDLIIPTVMLGYLAVYDLSQRSEGTLI